MLACRLITNRPFACKLIMTVPIIIILARGPPQGYITQIYKPSVRDPAVRCVKCPPISLSHPFSPLGWEGKGASVAAYFGAGHNHIVTSDYMPTFTARNVGSS